MTDSSIVIPKNLLALGVLESGQCVHLTKIKGKIQTRGSNHEINAQEAMLMMHRGELAISHCGIVLSMQECYVKLFPSNFSLELYLIHSMLSTAGFKFDYFDSIKSKSDNKKNKEKKRVRLETAPKIDGEVYIFHEFYSIYKQKPVVATEPQSSHSNEFYRLFVRKNSSTSVPRSMLEISQVSHNDSSIQSLLATDCEMETKFYKIKSMSHVPNAESFKKCSKRYKKPYS